MDRDPKLFWLITLGETAVNVSLVAAGPTVVIQASSRDLPWSENGEDVVTATDNAIAACSQQLGLTPDQEPDKAAFIISPFWVAGDGRIIDNKIKLIETICKQLRFKPMGFMPFDEAIVEEANSQDGIPASFVLAYVDSNQLIVSLTYLGKIKKRIRKLYSGHFDPVLLETSIIEMNVESALPPLINLCGQVDDLIGQAVKNYPWVGKKNIETFLHLPEVKVISKEDLTRLYARIIARQITPHGPAVTKETPAPSEEPTPVVSPSPVAETLVPEPAIGEVSLDDFGFTPVVDIPEAPSVPLPNPEPLPPPAESNVPLPAAYSEFVPEPEEPAIIPPPPKIPSVRLRPPKISFPSMSLPLWLYIIAGSAIFITLALHAVSTAAVDIYVTPYTFSQKATAIAATQNVTASSGSIFIPVEQKTVDVSVSDSLPATGKKTIGDKARGEIVIFNKQDKTQKITKGTVLVDNNLKFTLSTDVQIASSSSDLDKGVITLGQTRAMVEAADIGPEFNLPKDTALNFKDGAYSQLLAKVNTALAGGSKQDISAVSSDDRTKLESALTQKINEAVQARVQSDFGSLDLALPGTTVIKKNKVELNREVGEQADEVQGSATATISILIMSPDTKNHIIDELASRDPKYNEVNRTDASFNLLFTTKNSLDNQAEGDLTLSGSAPPTIDTSLLRQRIRLHPSKDAKSIIRQLIPRAYDVRLTVHSLSPLKVIDLLPALPQNIKITIHAG
ncbi:hypothetical protein M1116_03060 [Patescibacteria group bacterium]|nr:hypothetical protein [Patescibacteria group bacterium]